MASPIDQILSPALRSQLFAIQRTSTALGNVQLRLATGKEVNSALDNPQNFFAARALTYSANDLAKLLDSIDQNIQVVKMADKGVTAISKLLNLANTVSIDALEALGSGNQVLGLDLSAAILEEKPVAYWRLNETEGTTAINLGSGGVALDGAYVNTPTLGAGKIYLSGDVAVDFNGSNQSVDIPDSLLINTDPAGYAERTIELVFRAESTLERQVLYEEGGISNSLAIYVEDGRVYFSGHDDADWGPFDISVKIETGRTYHVTLVLDDPAGEFRAYVDGELIDTAVVTKPLTDHPANIAIGRMRQGAWFHDGVVANDGFYFKGQIAEVAIYNKVLTEDIIQKHYDITRLGEAKTFEKEFNAIMEQLDLLASDASYRGTNLLTGDVMTTFFNELRTSSLITEGAFLTSAGLKLSNVSFRSIIEIVDTLTNVRSAIEKVRGFGSKLSNDLNIVKTRKAHVQDNINTFTEGSDMLILADTHEEGAKALALATRQSIQMSTLSDSNSLLADLLFQR